MSKDKAYKAAGVDLRAAGIAKARIAELAKSTFTDGVVSEIGGFGGIYRFPAASGTLLLASSDGVGTKLMVAAAMGIYNTVGRDLVDHCVNDLLTLGAEPLFFLDYIGHADLSPDRIAELVEGLSIACRENGLALIGGETAQMPGLYSSGDFDIVGFIVGTTPESELIDGAAIASGDRLIALSSNGLMTNGYSLARRVLIDSGRFSLDDAPDVLGGATVGEALLAVHPSFLSPVKAMRASGVEITGMAHITGGGIAGNFVRVLPQNCSALFDLSEIPVPPIFDLIRASGEIPSSEMFEVFNMGVGFVIAVRAGDLDRALDSLRDAGAAAFSCGEIISGDRSVRIEGVN